MCWVGKGSDAKLAARLLVLNQPNRRHRISDGQTINRADQSTHFLRLRDARWIWVDRDVTTHLRGHVADDLDLFFGVIHDLRQKADLVNGPVKDDV